MLINQVLLKQRIPVIYVLFVALFTSANSYAASASQKNSAFNPAIGLILNGTYVQFSQDPDNYSLPGFPIDMESTPGTSGFSLGESELNISSNIDTDWYGAVTIAMSGDGEFSVENAFIQSTGLGSGFTIKGGRFFSGIGYLNEQHAHTWDFVDTALAYRALLGTQYGDDGVQVRWLAPTDLFTEIGAEWMRGDAFPGAGAKSGHAAWSAFIHLGGDVGISHSWAAGLSYLSTKSTNRETGNTDLFTGTSKIMIASLVWKWAPNGNASNRNFKLQAEYLLSKNDGQFTPAGGIATPYSATPDGWYIQSIYQFKPRWRTGFRHDHLNADSPVSGFTGTVLDDQNHNPVRNSLMLEYSNSEFSRFRLQYSRDESRPNADNQWFLQYIVSMGAHGAHTF